MHCTSAHDTLEKRAWLGPRLVHVAQRASVVREHGMNMVPLGHAKFLEHGLQASVWSLKNWGRHSHAHLLLSSSTR